MKYPPKFCFWCSSEASVDCVSCVSYMYLSLCVMALCQICVPCVNKNNFEHVRIFASHLRPSLRPLHPLHQLTEYRPNGHKAKNA